MGYFDKDTQNWIGAGMEITWDGWMYQGYFKDGKQHMNGRETWNGEIYEGGFYMGIKHGKGELMYYEEDERVERGQWDKSGGRQGQFECYDGKGRLTHRKTYENENEIK